MDNYTPASTLVLCDYFKRLFAITSALIRYEFEHDVPRRPVTNRSIELLINGLSRAYPLSREVDTTDEIYGRRREIGPITEDIGNWGARVLVFDIVTPRWRMFNRETGKSFSRSRNWERILERSVIFVIDGSGEYEEYL